MKPDGASKGLTPLPVTKGVRLPGRVPDKRSPISLPLVLELFLQETFLSVVSSRMMMAVQTVKTVV